MRKKIRSLADNKFIQGGFILTVSSFIVNILNYFFNSISAKALGPINYGEVTTTFAYMGLTSIPTTVSTAIIIRKLGLASKDDRLAVARSLEQWVWQKINTWKYFFVILFLSTLIIPKITNLSLISSFMITSGLSLSIISVVYGSIMQGMHFFLFFALLTILGVLFKFFGAFLVLLGFGGIGTIYLSMLIGSLICLSISARKIRSLYKSGLKKTDKINKRISYLLRDKKTLVTVVSLLSFSLFSSFDIMYVKRFFPAYDVGLYSSWLLFSRIILYFVGPINTISYIFFSDRENSKNRRKGLLLVIVLTFFAGIAGYAGYTLLGKYLVNIIFNDKYISILTLLPLAAVFGLFYAIITSVNNYFVAQNSKGSLIITISVPLYILSLLLFGKSMVNIMYVNIIFSAFLSCTFFIFIITNRD